MPGAHDHGHEHHHGGPLGAHSALYFSLIGGVFTGLGGLATLVDFLGVTSGLLYGLAYLFGAWFTVQEVAEGLRARRFEIDALMLVAAIGAALLGAWFEGALLLFLFSLGHALEGYAMGKARRELEALGELVPQTAQRLDDSGAQAEVPVAALVVGDRVRVAPHTRVPADGFVGEGTSCVNQAPITGESVPVDKGPVEDLDAALEAPERLDAAHRVFAGSVNGDGALTVVVTRPAQESALARMAQLVIEAQAQKAAAQRFAERFERIFVPSVLVLVVFLLFAGVVIDEPFARSFYRAMAVLVAASPCALAIATPSAVLSGVARAARAGVLFKGGAHLEALGGVREIAFDKTGTLTRGEPALTDCVPFEGRTAEELLALAAAVERASAHPIARAVVAAAQAHEGALAYPEVTDVAAIVGFGMRARLGEEDVRIGQETLFTQTAPLPAEVLAQTEVLRAAGRTLLLVQVGARFVGVLGVMDQPRAEAAGVVAQLRALGCTPWMLTGDHAQVGAEVGRQVGIDAVRAGLLPEEKRAVIAQLVAEKGAVAMVGDGVNDAPALAQATVGIAMGAGGSAVALQSADVALMADDLRALPFAVQLSRATRRIIRQNLWLSLGMVAVLIPATIFGGASIGLTVALHEGSTLLVVANALRLLGYRAP